MQLLVTVDTLNTVGGCRWLSVGLDPVGDERIASEIDRITGPGNRVGLPSNGKPGIALQNYSRILQNWTMESSCLLFN